MSKVMLEPRRVGDKEAIAQLEARLQVCLRLYIRDFRLTVHEGGLLLHGDAPSFYAKQIAQQQVMSSSQLPILANHILVK